MKSLIHYLKLLLVILIAVITSCDNDINYIEDNNNDSSKHNITSIKTLGYNDINNEKIKKKFEEIRDNFITKPRAVSRTNWEQIIIDTTSITQITTDQDYESYTFNVLDTEGNGVIENILISENLNDSIQAVLISYHLNSSISNDIEQSVAYTTFTPLDETTEILGSSSTNSRYYSCTTIYAIHEYPLCEGNLHPGPDCFEQDDNGDYTIPIMVRQHIIIVEECNYYGGGGGITNPNEGSNFDEDGNYTGGGYSTSDNPYDIIISAPLINFGYELIRILNLNLSDPQDLQIINYINSIYSGFSQNEEDNIITDSFEYLLLNNFSDSAIREVYLTLATLSVDVPWTNSEGNFNDLSSLHYNQTRQFTLNSSNQINNGGISITQYKLDSGDVISTGNYPICSGCSETEWRVYYYSQTTQLQYEIPDPTNYSPLTLDFLWEGFWDAVITGTRYCTPLEDVIILIDGRDLDNVEQSRAVAGAFILIDIIPGSSAVKALKFVKYGDEVIQMSQAVIKYADDTFKTQKNVIDNVLGDVDWYELDLFDNTRRKGNFGEMVTDTDLYSKGYEPLHNRITDIDQQLNQGIDGVFRNPHTGEFIIVESKFGQSGLNLSTETGPQMSSTWIESRIIDEVGEELGQEILDSGYTSVLAKVSQSGNVTYVELNHLAQEIGEWTP